MIIGFGPWVPLPYNGKMNGKYDWSGEERGKERERHREKPPINIINNAQLVAGAIGA